METASAPFGDADAPGGESSAVCETPIETQPSSASGARATRRSRETGRRNGRRIWRSPVKHATEGARPGDHASPKIERAMKTAFTEAAGVEVPLICGAMYPCSNPELVAAVSQAGGLGIVQPLSLVFVHKRDFRAGMREIRSLTKKPVGLNVLTEKFLSSVYAKRMSQYVDVALEEGVRFFVTALGNPRWVVDRVKSAGGVVYHDVVDRRWAEKAAAEGVDGLICVNRRAGGHLGKKSPEELYAELVDLKLPLVCAGGVGSAKEFRAMLDLGYAGVQCGTRFIAATECTP